MEITETILNRALNALIDTGFVERGRLEIQEKVDRFGRRENVTIFVPDVEGDRYRLRRNIRGNDLRRIITKSQSK